MTAQMVSAGALRAGDTVLINSGHGIRPCVLRGIRHDPDRGPHAWAEAADGSGVTTDFDFRNGDLVCRVDVNRMVA